MVVRHARRIPVPEGAAGDGTVVARQFDAALMSVGFKLSGDVLAALSGLSEQAVRGAAVRTLATVREMAGDHVRHNVYFRDFPRNVPDTLDFWMGLLQETLRDPEAAPGAIESLKRGSLNLLALVGYGRYQHTYEEMLAAHDELVAGAGDRVTVLHLGAGLDDEGQRLYQRLVDSVTPLGDEDLAALRILAEHYASGPHPPRIPVRENRAVINRVRLSIGADLLVDTVTDLLRLACALSGGDVTLAEPTRFVSMSRPVRRSLLAALDALVAADPGKLGDVAARREPWKRLGSGCIRTSTRSGRTPPMCSRSRGVRSGRRRSRGGSTRGSRRVTWPWRTWRRARPACCSGRWTGCCGWPRTIRMPCWRRPSRWRIACPAASCCRCGSICSTGTRRAGGGCSPIGWDGV